VRSTEPNEPLSFCQERIKGRVSKRGVTFSSYPAFLRTIAAKISSFRISELPNCVPSNSFKIAVI